MKKVILLFCFIPVTVFSQVSYNFETGSSHGWIQSIDNRWAADSTGPIMGKYSLHHTYDNSETGSDQIGTRLKRLHPESGTTSWSFKIRYGADPSSSNNWAVFLTADNDPSEMHPGGKINGYAMGVDLAGYDDTLRLWKVREGGISTVKSLPVNWQTDIGTATAARIDVERSAAGEWNMKVSYNSVVRTASCTDPDLFSVHWFGVCYKYTSTRDRLLWIDDISVDGFFEDTDDGPAIIKAYPAGRSMLEVFFDRDLTPFSALTGNFECLPSSGMPVSVTADESRKLRIIFPGNLPNKTPCTIVAKNICDADSICADNVSFEFTPAFAGPGDILISEIMADPLPPVSLPAKEYLEIKNATGYGYSLNSWKLITGTENSIFPDSFIGPGESEILCSVSDTGLFSVYGHVIGLKSFPALTDEGRTLVITDDLGNMIHWVSYSRGWYGDKLKSEGGWSLEIIDTGYPFFGEGNWRASVSPEGGTPGKTNSVSGNNPDKIFKGITNVFPTDSLTLIVIFSESVGDPGKLINLAGIGGTGIDSIISCNYTGMEFKAVAEKPFRKGKVYTFKIRAGLTDRAGNSPLRESFRFGIPEAPAVNEIVFNELLFNPLPGDADYIELFNNSDRVFDANRLYLVSLNDETADTSEPVVLSDTGRCILPGAYYTVTTSRDAIINRYYSNADTDIYEVSGLPSMPDDKGHLILLNAKAEKTDEVVYNEKMHFQLLSGFEGVSLEKIRPGFFSPDIKNWHSASEFSGWGTPGMINSAYTEMTGNGNAVVFSSNRISPDNDGNEDVLVIDLSLTGNSNVVTILVFDEYGSIVRKLVRNFYCSDKLSVVWDGTADNASVVDAGIYVILISVYDETGKTVKWKKACAVIR